MDNLTMNAIQCKAAGVSYGQWKAMNPVTKAIEIDECLVEKSCAYCGKQFKTKNKRKVFCCEECCHNAQLAKQRERRVSGNVKG